MKRTSIQKTYTHSYMKYSSQALCGKWRRVRCTLCIGSLLVFVEVLNSLCIPQHMPGILFLLNMFCNFHYIRHKHRFLTSKSKVCNCNIGWGCLRYRFDIGWVSMQSIGRSSNCSLKDKHCIRQYKSALIHRRLKHHWNCILQYMKCTLSDLSWSMSHMVSHSWVHMREQMLKRTLHCTNCNLQAYSSCNLAYRQCTWCQKDKIQYHKTSNLLVVRLHRFCKRSGKESKSLMIIVGKENTLTSTASMLFGLSKWNSF